jgi:hypothetical protein
VDEGVKAAFSSQPSAFSLEEFLQVLWGFAAGALFLVLFVPFEALLERGFGRHFVLFVPGFIHALSLSVLKQLPRG